MHSFSPDHLLNQLRSQGVEDEAALCVAFSGGLDSTALLHALTRIVHEGTRFRLRAVHVDHQLHADSGRWREHCAATAQRLHVPFTAVSVRIDASGEGVEAGARRARYDALRELLEPDEILLTAHHADDQLETMLLALVRGAGLTGLSGIVASQRFGPGRLVRPLLGSTRAQLEAWARAEGLEWIEDPSNQNTDLDRNFLRQRVLPALVERWPAAARSAARSADHAHEAQAMLDVVAKSDLESVAAGPCLDAVRLRNLEPARRRNLLRYWIRRRGARPPSTRRLAAVERDVLGAGADRCPCVEWDGVELRRYRGLLYLDRRLPAHEAARIEWDTRSPLELPAALGRLQLAPDPAGGLAARKLEATLAVRFRAGGEKLRPIGEAHRRSLKKMLQAAGVPPWRRARLPLIYSDDRLVAVGDLWIAEEFAARDGEEAVRIVWEKDVRT